MLVIVSECETQTVIKLAAAGIGSHEVLDVLLAEGKQVAHADELGSNKEVKSEDQSLKIRT